MAQYQVPSAPDTSDPPAAEPAAQPTAATPEGPAQPAEPQQPQLLAGKFKTPEELEKAYKELETKLGQPPPPPPAKQPGSTEIPQQAARQVVAEKGIDFDALTEEFATAGALSADTYAALAKAGIPQAVVDSYISGQQALAAKQAAEIFALVGGEEAYSQIVQWAAASLSREQIDAYNLAVNQGGHVAALAARGLAAQFAAEGNAAAPNLLHGKTPPGVGGYQSIQEMQRDMDDPRYLSGDPAFHAQVEAKLRAAAF